MWFEKMAKGLFPFECNSIDVPVIVRNMDTSVDFPGENLFDFTSIEALDPSIVEGFRVLYEREVPLEIRTQSFDGELTKPNLLVCAHYL